jgi:uncharacterized DUF497 family protein
MVWTGIHTYPEGIEVADVGFLWDEEKYARVRREHGVTFHEAIAALEDGNGYEAPDPQGHPDRCLYVGKTEAGRVLIVVYSDEELPVYRLITAYDAQGVWLDGYRRRV